MRTTTYDAIKELEALTEQAVAVVRQLLLDPETPRMVRLCAAELALNAAAGRGGDNQPTNRSGPRLIGERGPTPDRAA